MCNQGKTVAGQNERLRELVEALRRHPTCLGTSWRIDGVCVHCWAERLLGRTAERKEYA